MKKILSAVLSATLLASCIVLPAGAADKKTETITYRYDNGNWVHTREMEKLGRGLVAIKSDSDVYLSWRLLDSEDNIFGSADKNVTFNVYKDNSFVANVVDKTNYTISNGDINASYSVAPVVYGVEGTKETAIKNMENSYFDINLQKPDAARLPIYTTVSKWNYITDSNGARLPELDENGDAVTDSNGNPIYSSDFRDERATYKDVAYTINDCSTADLDGDGEYEIIVKWDAGGQDNSFNGVTGDVIIDAYKLNGNLMWRVNLGKNIRAGAHYTQFLVYDFDLDGKAEMICKTAPGSCGGDGNYVTKTSHINAIKSFSDTDNAADFRNSNGYILDGDEFLTVFDGETGAAVDTIYYPNQRVDYLLWGDKYGNRVDRFTADVAYMDGVNPYAVYMRGYYMGSTGQRETACAVSYKNKQLNCQHSFDTYNVNSYSSKSTSASYDSSGKYKGVSGYKSGYEIFAGEGNHNCTMADVDNDGKDEVITGANCYEFTDDNSEMVVKWSTFMEHGDALHIGDYDPTHEGLEFFTVHEDSGPNKLTGTAIGFGLSVIDPAINLNDPTDTETWNKLVMLHATLPDDTGRGLMANVGMGGYYQVHGSAGSATANNAMYIANGNNSFTPISTSVGTNFRVFWDADLYDEILDGTNISSWNKSTNKYQNILSASTYGCTSINSTKANPALQADLFGDWREEIVYPLTTNTALRVFSTTTPSDYKIKTLMQDPVYRSGVAAEQTAYNQPPHVGMYLAPEVFNGMLRTISVSNTKTSYNVGDDFDKTALTVTAHYSSGREDTVNDFTVSGYNPLVTGEQTVTISYEGKSATTKVNVQSGFTINDDGYITGYSGSRSSETIPVIINGKLIKGIADGALKNSSITRLTVYEDISYGADSLKSGATLVCFENSATHIYAEENSINYELMNAGRSYMNVTFEESEYSNYSGSAPIADLKAVTICSLTYTPGTRNTTETSCPFYRITAPNGNSYLRVHAQRFSSKNREGSITFNDMPDLSQLENYEFSMDYQIQTNSKGLEILIADTSGTEISRLNNTTSLSDSGWYHVTLSYSNGTYTQKITDSSGNIISSDTLSYTGGKAIGKLSFPVDSEVNETNYVYLDNISVTTPFDATVTLNITDSLGTVVPNAAVVIDGVTKTADANGAVTFDSIASGTHTVSITADQLGTCTKTLNVYTENQTSLLQTDKHYPLPITENPVITYTELSSGAQVSISCDTAGASIYYTTDGTAPTTDSTLYSGAFMVYEPATVKAIAVKAGLDDSEVVTKAIQISARSIAPVINITPSGEGKTITLTAETSGADIYYTLDGSMPSTDISTKYESPITVSDTTTIKAVAIKEGYLISPVSIATVTIEKAAAPTADTAAGTVEYGKLISLSTQTAGADIYYTTDGSVPTKSSTKYTGSIELTANTTIKAIAVKDGYKSSDVFEAAYTVSGEAPTDGIIFSVGSTTSTDGTVSVPVYAAFDSDEIDTRSYTLCVYYDPTIFEYVSVTSYDNIHDRDWDGEVEVKYNNTFNPGLLFNINLKAKDSAPDGTYPISINMEGSEIETTPKSPSMSISGNVTLNRSSASSKVEANITNSNGDVITSAENLKEFTANVVVEDTDSITGTDKANIILAVYDNSGRLILTDVSERNVSELSKVFSKTVKVPDNADVGSVKLMIWNGLGNMSPLCEAKPLLGN